MDLKSRKEKIKSFLPIKYFYEDCFEKNNRNTILADLKLKGLNESDIFKCGPLLKREQEHHLFRKYNYLKYRLFKLTSLKIDRISEKSVENIESVIEKIQQTRNIILKCNTRLVVKPATFCFEKDSFNGEEFVSNGFAHLIKAIDYFDHRRGIKFSTYAVWVLKRNLSRDRGNMFERRMALYEGFDNNNDDDKFDPIDSRDNLFTEINHEYNASFIKEMLDDFISKSKASTRDVEVLRRIYGVDGRNRSTLVEIGKALGISKERARQIKNKVVELLQQEKYKYDPVA